MGRADMLFAKDKAIGAPLIALHAVPDLPKKVQERLYFIRFEDMIDRPAACMSHIYAWLGLAPFDIDPEHLKTRIRESDSHYHMKYTHQQATRMPNRQGTTFRPASKPRSRRLVAGITRCITRNSARRPTCAVPPTSCGMPMR